MDCKDEQICRICMNCEPILDWHEELFDFSGISYKECYYKYTQLEEIVSDPFPQLLCGVCSTDLQSFHLLIEKAIANQKIFQQNWKQSFECGRATENEQYCMDDFEIIVPEIECVYVVDNNEDSCFLKSEVTEEMQEIESKLTDLQTDVQSPSSQFSPEQPGSPTISDEEVQAQKAREHLLRQQQQQRDVRKKPKCDRPSTNNDEYLIDDPDTPLQCPRTVSGSLKDENIEKPQSKDEIANEEKNYIGKSKPINTSVMCSYCSKVVHSVYYLKKHEETHKKDRAREKVCNICGLKTFTSNGLNNHMKIHEKNREKKYKCEFCDKAFFARGACNVHRRIHLGQMVKCPLCPKEFCRQIDVDKHMGTHSHARLNSGNSQITKITFVHCKKCDKMVNSRRYNDHRAKHLEEPVVQCTACKKDFFSRKRCTQHMRNVHNKFAGQYDDIAFYYDKYRPRLSRVLMKQQECLTEKILEINQ